MRQIAILPKIQYSYDMSAMSRILIYALAYSIIFGACQSSLPEAIENHLAQLPDQVNYNFHVKPILSDRCFACHGPDAQKREADLRLDIGADAHAANVLSGGQNSTLVQHILSTNPEQMMPPPSSNLRLSDEEKAILIKWIDNGAKYKPHWAFIKPNKAELPAVDNGWATNEIDHFIYRKIKQENLNPSEKANPEQLIRRLYFDITGLPPSIADLDKWHDIANPSRYEQLVDHLLEKPGYGERMTAHWLDVSRFADSEGYLDDFHHTFWPYRDWVIKAFNENLPYNDFILWQVGGDQIPDATRDQKLATAFNRHHKQNSEGGIIPEEFRVEYVADRTNTVGAAFMGLTLQCARCHDHKYDPISQEEYYELFSFFNSTVERGDGIFSLNAIEKGDRISNEYSMNSGPVLPLPDARVDSIRDFLLEEIEKKRIEIKNLEKENKTGFNAWLAENAHSNTIKNVVDKYTLSHITFDDMQEGTATDLANPKKASYWGSINTIDGKYGRAIRSDAHGQFVADGIPTIFEHNEPFTISFWIYTPELFDEAHVLYNGNNRIQGYRGWDVMLDSNRVHFRINHAHPYQSIDVATSEPLALNEWVHYTWTYDGSGSANGVHIYENGSEITPAVHRNYLYRSAHPYLEDKATVYMPYKGMIIGNRHYDQDFTNGRLDEIRILEREADPLVAKYLFNKELGTRTFNLALQQGSEEADRFYDLFIDPEIELKKKALLSIQLEAITAIDTVQEIMILGDMERARPTYVLNRGVYDAHGKQVARDVPESIFDWSDDLPKNRYGLGQWLTHPDNPLTARVAVNQIWYLFFGRGIVETVEDFGSQGALPSHPELLDWLAVDFQENHWDVKYLIKKMVMSSTYRQSSVVDAQHLEADPDNILLARAPRYRRSAEMIRDNVLAVSGLLHRKIGGPSQFPYQPPGLWKEVMTHTFFPEYEVDYNEGLYRRSIYTFWKRNMPPPGMLIFDASSRAECQMRRSRSNTPLQALLLLNDEQIIEGCRTMVERIWSEHDGNSEKVATHIFRQLTSREPTASEKSILMSQFVEAQQYYEKNIKNTLAYLEIGQKKIGRDLPLTSIAAMTRVATTVLNTTEAYYKN